MKKPELLLPAGNLDTLKTAIAYGADAVYIGGEAFSLRAKADNFDKETMTEAIGFAHAHGVKVYVTVNIFAHNADIDKAGPYLRELAGIRPDALIISDPGLFMMAKELAPGIDIHVSTQMNSTNYEAFLFWYRLGAKRVVNARELSLAELKEIRSRIPEDMEIESFVHGAMCISYSGRCLLSGYMTGRSANLGACTHPCRWNYAVMEEKRPGEYFPVEEDERGTYIFNSRDLCMIEHIPELIEAGVDSFKVEGRMKTQLYVAAAARAYRNAIDDYFTNPELYRQRIPLYKEEIGKCTYREFTTGFYFGKPNEEAQIYDSNTYVKNYTFLGSVAEVLPDGSVRIEQKNKFCTGDEIEILKKDLTSVFVKVLRIRDAATGADQESCPHSRQQLLITLTGTPEVYDILCVRSKEQ
jgi:putative protease